MKSIFLLALLAFNAVPVWAVNSAPVSRCFELFVRNSTLSTNFYTSQNLGLVGMNNNSFDPNRQEEAQRVEAVMRNDVFLRRSQFMLDETMRIFDSKTSSQMVVVYNGANHSAEIFNHLGSRADAVYLTPRYLDEKVDEGLLALSKNFPDLSVLNATEKNFVIRILTLFYELRGLQAEAPIKHLAEVLAGKSLESALGENDPMFAWHMFNMAQMPNYSLFEDFLFDASASDVNATAPSKFVINDFHFFNSVEFLNDLPSVQVLKQQGIKEVILALEGVTAGENTSLFKISKISAVNPIQLLLDSASSSSRRQLLGLFESTPGFRKIKNMLNKPMAINPILARLCAILQERYAANGIRVVVVGLEDEALKNEADQSAKDSKL